MQVVKQAAASQVKHCLGETHYVGGSKDVIAQGVTHGEFYGGQ